MHLELVYDCEECKDTKLVGICDGCGTEENNPHHQPSCRRPGFTKMKCFCQE